MDKRSVEDLKPNQSQKNRAPLQHVPSRSIDSTHAESRHEDTPVVRSRGVKINDSELISNLDRYSIEDVVELKISRFLDQIGSFFPEDVHELIMSKVEKPLLVQVLRRVGGNQVQAAKVLGINRNTLRKKMKLYGLV